MTTAPRGSLPPSRSVAVVRAVLGVRRKGERLTGGERGGAQPLTTHTEGHRPPVIRTGEGP